MNRFSNQRTHSVIKTLLPTVIIVITVFILLFYGLSRTQAVSNTEQMNSLETAVRHGIIHCYSSEGSYPESLSYLEDHYGITYNHDKFYIDYRPIAANIMPDVTIISLEEQDE